LFFGHKTAFNPKSLIRHLFATLVRKLLWIVDLSLFIEVPLNSLEALVDGEDANHKAVGFAKRGVGVVRT
jgi:hypothetical protein